MKLAASSGKRNVTIWRPSVRLSRVFLILIGRGVHTQRDSPAIYLNVSVGHTEGNIFDCSLLQAGLHTSTVYFLFFIDSDIFTI